MLGNDPFYFGSIRKVLIAFGQIFTDIHILRTDANGNTIQAEKLPIVFGPKEKFEYRRLEDPSPNKDDQIEVVLPRASYNIAGMTYDPARKLVSLGRNSYQSGSASTRVYQYNPVPYNIAFQMDIAVRNHADGWMIIEQILPFFQPDYTVTVMDVPELQLQKDIPIVLEGLSFTEDWDEKFDKVREISYTLNFTAKAYLYPPVKTQSVIKTSIVNVGIVEDDTTLSVNPGMVPPAFIATATVNPPTAQASDSFTIDTSIVDKGEN